MSTFSKETFSIWFQHPDYAIENLNVLVDT